MWIERTMESVEEQQALFDGMTARELEEHKKATGIHKSMSFFQTIPMFNWVDMRQQDGMHTAVGLAEREGAQMIEHFVRRRREFSLGQYNATLLDFKEDLDEPIDLPELHCCVLDRKNGISKGSLRMNSSQVHEFVRYRCRSPRQAAPRRRPRFGPRPHPRCRSRHRLLAAANSASVLSLVVVSLPHSVDIIEPLLSEAGLASNVWLSWKAHVRYFLLLIQPSFTHAQIKELDRAILEHQELYSKVGAHYVFYPKHHFITHIPKGIYKAGPPRHHWCYPFEGYLRQVKKWIQHGNGKAVLKYAATRIALKFALSRAA